MCMQDVSAVSDNAAVLQQRVTKGTNPFLSTLAEPGEAQFLSVLKPCGILLPHTHQRANEFYSVIFGASPPSHVPLCVRAALLLPHCCSYLLQPCLLQTPDVLLWRCQPLLHGSLEVRVDCVLDLRTG